MFQGCCFFGLVCSTTVHIKPGCKVLTMSCLKNIIITFWSIKVFVHF